MRSSYCSVESYYYHVTGDHAAFLSSVIKYVVVSECGIKINRDQTGCDKASGLCTGVGMSRRRISGVSSSAVLPKLTFPIFR